MPRSNWLRKSITSLNAQLMFSCHDMTRLISQAQDGALPGLVRCKMRLHYLLCTGCRRYREHLGLLRTAVHKLSDSAESNTAYALPEESRNKLKQLLRDQSTAELRPDDSAKDVPAITHAAAAGTQKIVEFPIAHRSRWSRHPRPALT